MAGKSFIKQIISRAHPYFLSLPFFLLMAILFLADILNAIVQSLGYLPFAGLYDISLKYYLQVLKDPIFLHSLIYTFYIAFVSSALSIIIGLAITLLIRHNIKEKSFLYSLYRTPIILPHIIAAYFIFFLFLQTGMVSRFFYALGIINDPNNFPLFIYDTYGFGMIFVYLYKQIPFVTLFILYMSPNFSSQYEAVAKNLGANFYQRLRFIIIPLLLPSLSAAFLITFAFDFGSFEIPLILGSPAQLTLPLKAYIDYTNPDFALRPYALALNILISFFSLALIALYYFISKQFNRVNLDWNKK